MDKHISLRFLVLILMNVLVYQVESCLSRKHKVCNCVVADTIKRDGRCLKEIPCLTYQTFPSTVKNQRLGSRYIIYMQQLRHAYPAANTPLHRCAIVGTTYVKEFNVCTKRLRCGEPVLGVANGAVSNRYYVWNSKLYKSYALLCSTV
ncbi:uncharacterized protein LOC124454463 [Xenia sp. Carnegie-2017]|uniref:uncharacterized protein LOC124454463 n=1 Tax=Xenia sp. Carnegie-2017 TaxID=2897299 RepID=UPI001F04649C|nr:uncharacterized protein LOC124454463 [Xenia sp. Carnegie-2017]